MEGCVSVLTRGSKGHKREVGVWLRQVEEVMGNSNAELFSPEVGRVGVWKRKKGLMGRNVWIIWSAVEVESQSVEGTLSKTNINQSCMTVKGISNGRGREHIGTAMAKGVKGFERVYPEGPEW